MAIEKEQHAIELIDLITDVQKRIINNSNKMDRQFKKSGDEAKKFGNSIGKDLSNELKNSISQFVGVAAAAMAVKKALTFTTNAVFSFSGASAKLKAIVQPTTAEFVNLEKAALKLGSTTAFTASQVMNAFTEQAKLGQKVNEILASGNSVLNLAAMSQIGLAEAAEMTVQTLNQFNLDAEHTNKVVDVMAKSFTSSALDAGKFAESMKYAGTIGAVTGDSIEDVSAVLGVLADRSIEASMAGTATRRVMIRLADANSYASKKIAATGQKANTFVEKLKVLKTLSPDLTETTKMFGTLSSTAATVLIGAANDVEVLSTSLQDAEGSAERMAETMLESLPGAAVKMKSALEGLALTTKDVLTPALTTLMNKITGLASAWTWLLKGAKEQEKINAMNSETISGMKKLTDELRAWEKAVKEGNEEFVKSPLSGRGRAYRTEKAVKQIENLKNQIRELNGEFQKSIGALTIETPSKQKDITKTGSIDTSEIKKRIKQQKKLADSIKKIQQETVLQNLTGREKELQSLDDWYLTQQEKFKTNKEHLATLQTEFNERKIMVFASYAEKEAEKEKELINKKKIWLESLAEKEKELIDKKKIWLESLAEKNKEVLQQRAADDQQFRTSMISSGIDSFNVLANAMFTIGKNRTNNEKRQNIERIRNSNKTEKQKEAAIEVIEKEAFAKNKKRMIAQAIMNGALGVTKTLATVAFPKSIPVLIMQGAMVAANIATIASQKFGKGINSSSNGVVQQEPGLSPTGDQHLIRVNPGEIIRTPEQERALGSSINMGNTNINIYGNIDQNSLNQIDSILQDRNEEIRDSLLQLQDSGRISGVSF